jgi:hypothetical protein
MSHYILRKRHLLSDGLIRNEERLPTAAYTCWTVVLVTVSLTLIALSALHPPGF